MVGTVGVCVAEEFSDFASATCFTLLPDELVKTLLVLFPVLQLLDEIEEGSDPLSHFLKRLTRDCN